MLVHRRVFPDSSRFSVAFRKTLFHNEQKKQELIGQFGVRGGEHTGYGTEMMRTDIGAIMDGGNLI